MKLPDRLHCPNCKGRLTGTASDLLRCADCERAVPIVDGIADFVGDTLELDPNSDRYRGDPRLTDAAATALWARILASAGDRWPGFLGDTIEFGCGRGEATRALATGQRFRTLLVVDTSIDQLQACRSRLVPLGLGADQPVAYAMLGGARGPIRDAVADTVIGTASLAGVGDVPAFLAMVHRVLRPGGRAAFIVPNSRYHEAMCLAMAAALVQRRVSDGKWLEGQETALEILSTTKHVLMHRSDPGFFTDSGLVNLFETDSLVDLCRETGFAVAEILLLDPDPTGADTISRTCHAAGAPESFTQAFGALAAAVGKPFFNLLGRPDSSASMLLLLTKASGPDVRFFAPRPMPPPADFARPEVALGGAAPRWSVELLAHEVSDGVLLSVGGWCLCNSDVRWVRLTLDGVTRDAPVWRPRPDVHDVLNSDRRYHPLNALCSGLASEILFKGAHASDGACPLRMEVILASGLVVTGLAPDMLMMNEQMVIAH